MADEIRVDYAQLQRVAAQFSRQANAVNQMQQQMKHRTGQLQNAWVGKGSSAFFAEMNDKVLPAADRLYRALQEAGKTTQQIARLMEQAEQDAAAPFRTGAEGGAELSQASSFVLPLVGAIGAALFTVPIIGIVSNISRNWSATTGEKEHIRIAREVLASIKGLKPDEWTKLDVAERTAVLQQVEEAVASAQGRPAMRIESANFPNGKLGEYDGTVLRIDEDALKGDNLHGVLDTVVHEGRHAYQDYAIQHPGFHPDAAEVEAWRANMQNYQEAGVVGMKRYWNQPIEVDARHFADQFADVVAPQSLFKEVFEEANEVLTGVIAD